MLWLFQGTSLFGANKPAFGATPVTSVTGFGQPNLFGANKPAGTGLFGTPGQTPGFGRLIFHKNS
jgi:hypothetical protein